FTRTDVSAGGLCMAAAFADLNGDGKPDLAVADAGFVTVNVLLGDGVGGFGPSVSHPIALNPSSVAIADLNGDGKVDLIVGGENGFSVLEGDGVGGFGTHVD